jgi:hypothetical protein
VLANGNYGFTYGYNRGSEALPDCNAGYVLTTGEQP